jgi:hypothetical protein
VLNFLSRPPNQRSSHSHFKTLGASSQTQNTDIHSRCKNYLHLDERFFGARFPTDIFQDGTCQFDLGSNEAKLESSVIEREYYCGFAWLFASRLSRASSAHIFRCSGVRTLHTCLRVSIFICFAFFCLWSSLSVLSFCIALSWS